MTVIDNLTQRGNSQCGRTTHGKYSIACTKSLHYWSSTEILPRSNSNCNLSNLSISMYICWSRNMKTATSSDVSDSYSAGVLFELRTGHISLWLEFSRKILGHYLRLGHDCSIHTITISLLIAMEKLWRVWCEIYTVNKPDESCLGFYILLAGK